MGLLGNLFDDNAKDIKKYRKKLERINAFEPQVAAYDDAALTAKTAEFKRRLEQGESLDELMFESFAVVREAAKRSLGMRHFDVQLIGGMALFDGRIAEMKTGEGKTLVATAPAYTHALTGRGVHVITVNDYLARRDSEWMGRVYRFLGMNVGLVVHGVEAEEKKAAYLADITYGTNNEFGFDYLRDNMAFSKDRMVQRPLYYCIVDEVDSILIDEARTPLIISGPSAKPTERYYQAAKIVTRLKEEPQAEKDEEQTGDFTIDVKSRSIALTEAGMRKAEAALGVDNLTDDRNTELLHHINQALKAQYIFKRDRDYVVKDGEVLIVDEFTGRLMFGRRYSDGLHQAIEAKENVKIERESQTLATITFQNYFRMYERLAGMTGTALTEEEEFRKIYNFDVVEIPTNMPMIRQDNPDIIYRTEPGKFDAVIEEIAAEHAKGRPVLVGTISIEKSELLSRMLKNRGIEHHVLNAKFHEQEAAIIAEAGREGAVTIATNMAGRGTDIVLGGNPEALARAEYSRREDKPEDLIAQAEELAALTEKYRAAGAAEHQRVVEAGGLHIIGTERHESRRIDNQLRGRAGRQGDPGSSRFFISMEDDLIKRFGGDNLGNLMDKVGVDDTMPIDSALVSRGIENAQRRVEERHFDARKHVLEYDDVMNAQRELIYSERRKALYEDDVHDSVLGMLEAAVNAVLGRYSAASNFPEEWDLPALLADMAEYLPADKLPEAAFLRDLAKEEVYEHFQQAFVDYYDSRRQSMGAETLNRLEHIVILNVVDNKWMEHLDAMDQLRQGIGLRAYGQENPLIAYKRESFDMFEAMIEDIQLNVARMVLRAELVERPVEREGVTASHGGSSGGTAKKVPLKRKDAKVGRNDPCPCGSGKKYKNCCGRA
ncbi:MAG: preprotein translocase subunit SecA [Bacillota bacterium]|nr:preprotein translocase subunit SecA [Bacillota bacterium]